MRFVDEVQIQITAGDGGDGMASFHRGRNLPKGGPDGGDGGDGGDVYLQASTAVPTLARFRYDKDFHASSGGQGAGTNRHGARGKDLILDVPEGTSVRDANTGELIGELTSEGQRLLVARGGNGGVGNYRFRSSTNRIPRQFVPGTEGETRGLDMEMTLLAQVGLVGAPNAGKSSLLTQLSAAKPRIADYPFTTLHPELGIIDMPDFAGGLTLADIPGLIAGAAQGVGLGHRFLKHVRRTALLLHLVDAGAGSPDEIVAALQEVRGELEAYSQGIEAKPCWLLLHKSDLKVDPEERQEIEDTIKQAFGSDAFFDKCFWCSSATREGLRELRSALAEAHQHMMQERLSKNSRASEPGSPEDEPDSWNSEDDWDG